MTESLIDRIKRHEGLRLAPYQDSRGNWTWGYGTEIPRDQIREILLDKRQLTEAKAHDLLLEKMNQVGTDIHAALPWVMLINGARNGVLIEMAYQLGVEGLLKFKRMLLACENGAYGTAAAEMLHSAWHDETPARCEELAQIMREGVTV